jgi:hypothetical protein
LDPGEAREAAKQAQRLEDLDPIEPVGPIEDPVAESEAPPEQGDK